MAKGIPIEIDPTVEAKICLTCDKTKCYPDSCRRFQRELRRLTKGETRLERVARLIEEEYEKALECRWISRKLAYAVYQVWKIIDSEEGGKNEAN